MIQTLLGTKLGMTQIFDENNVLVPVTVVEAGPCPIIQVATENIKDRASIYETLTESEFLKDFRETAAQHTRGCIVLERPDLVKELAEKHGAKDTTIRKTALAELDSMTPRNSQWMPTGDEIPEKHPVYRWAKRVWFNDFGVYENLGKEEPGN